MNINKKFIAIALALIVMLASILFPEKANQCTSGVVILIIRNVWWPKTQWFAFIVWVIGVTNLLIISIP
jgi:hypothetical protein